MAKAKGQDDQERPGRDSEGQEPTEGNPESGQDSQEDKDKTFGAEYVKDLRDEAAEWRRKFRELEAEEKKREKAEEDAEQAQLKEKEEWRKLAEKHEARVKELEPLSAEVEQYRETIEELLNTKLEALGDGAKAAVEALPEGLAALDKLRWLNANEGLFAAKQTPPNINAGDGGRGGDGSDEAKTERIKRRFGI